MLRKATIHDFESCLKLLNLLDKKIKPLEADLFLRENSYGYTLVIEQEANVIGMSTFAQRHKVSNGLKINTLYWENLVVGKSSRDGTSYLQILGFLRKQIRLKNIDDVYFVARRRKALDVHKAARFKEVGKVGLFFERFQIKTFRKQQPTSTVVTYEDFVTKTNVSDELVCQIIDGIKGETRITYDVLKRQLRNKLGHIVIDHDSKQTFFIRSLYSNRLITINLFLFESRSSSKLDFSYINNSVFSLSFGLKFLKKNHHSKFFNGPILTYSLLSLAGLISEDNFEFWEHDAW